jgi:8-hydroxy-5-deazaflavin:NADPH oxidoreductase
MKIGIIGAGHIGGTVAKRFVDTGHEVAVSNSRDPKTLAGLVEGLGSRAQAMTATDAERFGDLIVINPERGPTRKACPQRSCAPASPHEIGTVKKTRYR